MNSPPRQPYLLADGTRVPSVTTVLSRFKESGGLIHWAWGLGIKGLDYRDVRGDAADAGTLAHRMVEADIRGLPPYADPMADPDVVKRARQAFENYLTWKGQTHLEPVRSEVRLVSEKHRFGGTLDVMLMYGRRSIADLKTGALYPEHLIQVAAYAMLWDECYPEERIDGGYHVLNISRESADFSHHHFVDLDEAREAFLLLRRLYDLDQSLKRRAR